MDAIDARLLYWGAALLNMAVMFGLMLHGVRKARRGRIAAHRRAMLTASVLVVLFLLSFVLKSIWLGREEYTQWSAAALWLLRFHESCVLAMLVSGAVALQRAWRMRGTRVVTRDALDPPTPEVVRRWHRGAGWTAVVSAGLGLLSACGVFAGMVGRLG